MTQTRMLNEEQMEDICTEVARICGNSLTPDPNVSSSKMPTKAQGDKLIQQLSSVDPEPTSWAEASDSKIIELVQKSDAGEIDLARDYGWAVGDRRMVTMSAWVGNGYTVPQQQIPLILVDTDHFLLTTRTTARTTSTFVVLIGAWITMINGTNLNIVQLPADNTYTEHPGEDISYSALTNERSRMSTFPSLINGIGSIFKQFQVKTGYSRSNTLETTNEYFSFMSAKEYVGEHSTMHIVTAPSTYTSGTMETFITQQEWDNTSQLEWFKSSGNVARPLNDNNGQWSTYTQPSQSNLKNYNIGLRTPNCCVMTGPTTVSQNYTWTANFNPYGDLTPSRSAYGGDSGSCAGIIGCI